MVHPCRVTTSAAHIDIVPVRYPLARPIFTASASIFERTGALVRITDGDLVGWGEALPIPGWPTGDLPSMMRSLRSWIRVANMTPEKSLCTLDAKLPDHPVAAAAVDCARYDLACRKRAVPMSAALSLDPDRAPDAPPRRIGTSIAVNGLVGGRNAREAAKSARLLVESGIRTLKLKVGSNHISADEERLERIRNVVGSDIAIRLDANQAWRLREAHDHLARLEPFGIEYIEEPVGSLVEFRQLRPDSPIPIYIDELLADPRSAKQIIGRDFADGVVLKPAALGSLRATRKLAERAIHSGMGVTITNVLDSGLGTTMALHLAASIGGPINACGLATGDLFLASPAPPPPVVDGEIAVPLDPGLGIEPTIGDRILAPDL